MLNQEERDLELALSLQEQEIEERRAWVVALAGGQQYTRGQHHQRVGTRENTGRKKTCRNCLILATALLILVGIGIALAVWFA